MKSISRLIAALLCVAALAWGGGARAAYPDKTIWWIVPYSVGGSADVVSRMLAVRIGEKLNQRILVDNKPGASGAIGEEFVSRAPPDGYTVLYDAFALAVNPSLRKMRFDPEKDLQPVTQVSNMWVIMVAPANAPYNTLAEFIDFAQKNPGKASHGSAGAGTSGHLTGELFKSLIKSDMVHVPYKGGGPAVTAAIGGEVSVYYATGGSAMASIRAGKLKALAVAAPNRMPALPNVPTFAELGYPDVLASEWTGIFVPKDTPADIVQLLNREVRATLADPKVHEQMSNLGIDTVTSGPREFAQFVHGEMQRWGRIVKQLNLTTE
jgi:tripartite-type tricarboxylate transporter receptor subunit TctC